MGLWFAVFPTAETLSAQAVAAAHVVGSSRVVAITRGSTVDFPNGDPFFHDVLSLSRRGTFDLGSYPRGQTKAHQFRQAGLVKVYCHIHSHMTASIMVFDHPFFTIPKPDGTFAIVGTDGSAEG